MAKAIYSHLLNIALPWFQLSISYLLYVLIPIIYPHLTTRNIVLSLAAILLEVLELYILHLLFYRIMSTTHQAPVLFCARCGTVSIDAEICPICSNRLKKLAKAATPHHLVSFDEVPEFGRHMLRKRSHNIISSPKSVQKSSSFLSSPQLRKTTYLSPRQYRVSKLPLEVLSAPTSPTGSPLASPTPSSSPKRYTNIYNATTSEPTPVPNENSSNSITTTSPNIESVQESIQTEAEHHIVASPSPTTEETIPSLILDTIEPQNSPATTQSLTPPAQSPRDTPQSPTVTAQSSFDSTQFNQDSIQSPPSVIVSPPTVSLPPLSVPAISPDTSVAPISPRTRRFSQSSPSLLKFLPEAMLREDLTQKIPTPQVVNDNSTPLASASIIRPPLSSTSSMLSKRSKGRVSVMKKTDPEEDPYMENLKSIYREIASKRKSIRVDMLPSHLLELATSNVKYDDNSFGRKSTRSDPRRNARTLSAYLISVLLPYHL